MKTILSPSARVICLSFVFSTASLYANAQTCGYEFRKRSSEVDLQSPRVKKVFQSAFNVLYLAHQKTNAFVETLLRRPAPRDTLPNYLKSDSPAQLRYDIGIALVRAGSREKGIEIIREAFERGYEFSEIIQNLHVKKLKRLGILEGVRDSVFRGFERKFDDLAVFERKLQMMPIPSKFWTLSNTVSFPLSSQVYLRQLLTLFKAYESASLEIPRSDVVAAIDYIRLAWSAHSRWLQLSVESYRQEFTKLEDYSSIDELAAINPQHGGKGYTSDSYWITGAFRSDVFLQGLLGVGKFREHGLKFLSEYPDSQRKVDLMLGALKEFPNDLNPSWVDGYFKELDRTVTNCRVGLERWGYREGYTGSEQGPGMTVDSSQRSKWPTARFNRSHFVTSVEIEKARYLIRSSEDQQKRRGWFIIEGLSSFDVLGRNYFSVDSSESSILSKVPEFNRFPSGLFQAAFIAENLHLMRSGDAKRQMTLKGLGALSMQKAARSPEEEEARLEIFKRLIFALSVESPRTSVLDLAEAIYPSESIPRNLKRAAHDIRNTIWLINDIATEGKEKLASLRVFKPQDRVFFLEWGSNIDLLVLLGAKDLRQKLGISEEQVIEYASQTIRHLPKRNEEESIWYKDSERLVDAIKNLEISASARDELLLWTLQGVLPDTARFLSHKYENNQDIHNRTDWGRLEQLDFLLKSNQFPGTRNAFLEEVQILLEHGGHGNRYSTRDLSEWVIHALVGGE